MAQRQHCIIFRALMLQTSRICQSTTTLLTQLTTRFYGTEPISSITPHCPTCAANPTPITPRAGLPCPPSSFTVPPPAGSHPPCPRSQRCRWMGYWNQTPSCSGWMGFSCAPVFAAKKWCRLIKNPSPSVDSLEQMYDHILKLPYRGTCSKFLCPTLEVHINTSKCKSDIEAQLKKSAWIKGSSWHHTPAKCEHADQSSGLCCWQHPPGPSLNTQPSIKSSSTLIFNSFSNTLAMLSLKTLRFEILKSYCWRLCLFALSTQHLHIKNTDTKARQEQPWSSFCWGSQTSLSISQRSTEDQVPFAGQTNGLAPVQTGILRNIKHKLPTTGSSIKCFGGEWPTLSRHQHQVQGTKEHR